MSCYDRPVRCTSGPQPGALGLMDAMLLVLTGLVSWGIYNCRPVNHPGGGGLSVHGEGRAGDTAGRFGLMQALVDVLLTRIEIGGRRDTIAGHLGLQFIIFNRIKYGCEWDWEPRAYGGYAHTDHVHWELMWWAARLERETMRTRAIALLRGEEVDDLAQVPQDDWEAVQAQVDDTAVAVRELRAQVDAMIGRRLYSNKKGVLAALIKQLETENPDGTTTIRHVEAIDYFADLITAQVADLAKNQRLIMEHLGIPVPPEGDGG